MGPGAILLFRCPLNGNHQMASATCSSGLSRLPAKTMAVLPSGRLVQLKPERSVGTVDEPEELHHATNDPFCTDSIRAGRDDWCRAGAAERVPAECAAWADGNSERNIDDNAIAKPSGIGDTDPESGSAHHRHRTPANGSACCVSCQRNRYARPVLLCCQTSRYAARLYYHGGLRRCDCLPTPATLKS